MNSETKLDNLPGINISSNESKLLSNKLKKIKPTEKDIAIEFSTDALKKSSTIKSELINELLIDQPSVNLKAQASTKTNLKRDAIPEETAAKSDDDIYAADYSNDTITTTDRPDENLLRKTLENNYEKVEIKEKTFPVSDIKEEMKSKISITKPSAPKAPKKKNNKKLAKLVKEDDTARALRDLELCLKQHEKMVIEKKFSYEEFFNDITQINQDLEEANKQYQTKSLFDRLSWIGGFLKRKTSTKEILSSLLPQMFPSKQVMLDDYIASTGIAGIKPEDKAIAVLDEIDIKLNELEEIKKKPSLDDGMGVSMAFVKQVKNGFDLKKLKIRIASVKLKQLLDELQLVAEPPAGHPLAELNEKIAGFILGKNLPKNHKELHMFQTKILDPVINEINKHNEEQIKKDENLRKNIRKMNYYRDVISFINHETNNTPGKLDEVEELFLKVRFYQRISYVALALLAFTIGVLGLVLLFSPAAPAGIAGIFTALTIAASAGYLINFGIDMARIGYKKYQRIPLSYDDTYNAALTVLYTALALPGLIFTSVTTVVAVTFDAIKSTAGFIKGIVWEPISNVIYAVDGPSPVTSLFLKLRENFNWFYQTPKTSINDSDRDVELPYIKGKDAEDFEEITSTQHITPKMGFFKSLIKAVSITFTWKAIKESMTEAVDTISSYASKIADFFADKKKGIREQIKVIYKKNEIISEETTSKKEKNAPVSSGGMFKNITKQDDDDNDNAPSNDKTPEMECPS